MKKFPFKHLFNKENRKKNYVFSQKSIFLVRFGFLIQNKTKCINVPFPP